MSFISAGKLTSVPVLVLSSRIGLAWGSDCRPLIARAGHVMLMGREQRSSSRPFLNAVPKILEYYTIFGRTFPCYRHQHRYYRPGGATVDP